LEACRQPLDLSSGHCLSQRQRRSRDAGRAGLGGERERASCPSRTENRAAREHQGQGHRKLAGTMDEMAALWRPLSPSLRVLGTMTTSAMASACWSKNALGP